MLGNETITIKRVGNGFMVQSDTAPNCPIADADILVFQELGFAVNGGDDSESLLTFLSRHFADSGAGGGE